MSFTDPDPAATDDEPEVSFIPEEGSMLEMIDDRVTCENCVHYRVCALVSGYRQMTQQWGAGSEDDDAPIDAEDFAVVCEEFQAVEELD